MQQRFQLAAPLAFADVERITNILCTLPGVEGLDMSPGSRVVQVQFDEGRTSSQDIVDAAAKAGYHEMRQAPAGGCCGGCCGS